MVIIQPQTQRGEPAKTSRAGRCAPLLAEELSKETSVTIPQAYDVLEDLARRYPDLITIRCPV